MTQVPPYLHGFDWHSSTSSVHVGPLNPFGQTHLNVPVGSDVHVAPLRHGADAQRFWRSQCSPN